MKSLSKSLTAKINVELSLVRISIPTKLIYTEDNYIECMTSLFTFYINHFIGIDFINSRIQKL